MTAPMLKNGFVYIKAVQCDQCKKLGHRTAAFESDFISQMEDDKEVEKTVFAATKDLPDPHRITKKTS